MLRKQLSRSTNKKRTLLTLGTLLLVNAGIAQIVIAQIHPRSAGTQQVLGTEAIAPQGQVVPDSATGTAASDDQADAPVDSKEITIYTVKSGDTISGIAQQFDITTGTIYAANDLTKNQKLKVGQKLVILPITGIQYKVKSGDTISEISQKFDVPAADILEFNGIDDASKIKIGDELIIPNADVQPAPAPTPKPSSAASGKKSNSGDDTKVSTETPEKVPVKKSTESSTLSLGLIVPVPGSILTQGLHDVNAVDFGAPIGTTIRAAKGGTVIVAKNAGYNGGFGKFVVIDNGGMQTLYAHMSEVDVKVGDDVDQGDKIGEVGSTGKSTGPHCHFEVHGASNPWAHDKKGTHF